MKLALAAVIEKAECRVAALLDLCNDEVGADRVDGAGRHGDDIARRHRLPRDEIRDRAVVDGLTQVLRRHLPVRAEGDLGSGCRAQNIPSFGLAVRQSNRLRISIVGMDLDGERLAGEQQFEQQRGVDAGLPGRSYQISPMAMPSSAAMTGNFRPTTPQGLGTGLFAQIRSPWCYLW